MKIFEKPIFFENNRVFRVYQGGRLLDKFLGKNGQDGNYPEEWIASAVKAQNPDSSCENEGISYIREYNIYLDKLIQKYPTEILGNKPECGILVKFLDSAIRLPIQAHPDKDFAKKYFNSEHGKEESWIILDTRPGGCVYFGFKSGVTKTDFTEAVAKSKTDKNIMEKLLVRHDVKPGDVIFVPAKTVHAIGAGCLILEIQEPTDFTIQPEHWCGNYELSNQEMYLGLSENTAFNCFDFKEYTNIKIQPKILCSDKNISIFQLIGANQTNNFTVNRINISGGSYTPNQSAGIYVIISGTGNISGNNYSRALKQGDYFLLPHLACEKFTIAGNLTLIECFS